MLTKMDQKALDELRPNPDPRIVAMLDFAIEQIIPRLSTPFHREHSGKWLEWAIDWRAGRRRSPQTCVDIARWCFDQKGWGIDGKSTDPVSHALGQLAWGAKESCYSTKQSAWLVIRYIADAMVAFGIAFPEKGMALLERPTIEGEQTPPLLDDYQ
jgi:hypothetical protein